MELSLFLAKLFGIYLLTMSAIVAVRGKVVAGAIEDMFANRSALFISGVLALLVGIAMAIGHTVWEPNWRGVITVFGYGAIVKGVTRLAFPETVQKAIGSMSSPTARWTLAAFALFIGSYLTWAGFTQG